MQLQSYEKTPIYRQARDVLRAAHAITARMSKAYKYTLGDTLRVAALQLTECVFLAYEEKRLPARLGHIESIAMATQRLLINYRIAHDLQLVAQQTYGEQVEALVNIVRQTRGWQAATEASIYENPKPERNDPR